MTPDSGQSALLQPPGGGSGTRFTPDLLACIPGTEEGKFRFSVLETKGEHLKGNDDTAYTRKLFELLTQHVETGIQAGAFDFGDGAQSISFTMLMEDSWRVELPRLAIV